MIASSFIVSRDTTGRGMGRGCGVATHEQDPVSQLDGLSDHPRCRLESSVLHVRYIIRLYRLHDRELRSQRMDDRADKHQSDDRSERADADRAGRQANVVDRE